LSTVKERSVRLTGDKSQGTMTKSEGNMIQ
jgi:hypothetical protein